MNVTTVAAPTGHPGYSETLPCEEASVRAARRLVRAAIAVWRMEDWAEDGAVIISELAANAVRHTRSRYMRVTVSRPSPNWVRIAVVDKSRAMPEPRSAAAADTDGRGLLVVEALSDRWGTDRLSWGKRVWAEKRTDATP